MTFSLSAPRKSTRMDIYMGPDKYMDWVPAYSEIPKEFKDGGHPLAELAELWFFKRIPVKELDNFIPNEGIIKVDAIGHIKTVLMSMDESFDFGHKIAAAAYLMSMWFTKVPSLSLRTPLSLHDPEICDCQSRATEEALTLAKLQKLPVRLAAFEAPIRFSRMRREIDKGRVYAVSSFTFRGVTLWAVAPENIRDLNSAFSPMPPGITSILGWWYEGGDEEEDVPFCVCQSKENAQKSLRESVTKALTANSLPTPGSDSVVPTGKFGNRPHVRRG